MFNMCRPLRRCLCLCLPWWTQLCMPANCPGAAQVVTTRCRSRRRVPDVKRTEHEKLSIQAQTEAQPCIRERNLRRSNFLLWDASSTRPAAEGADRLVGKLRVHERGCKRAENNLTHADEAVRRAKILTQQHCCDPKNEEERSANPKSTISRKSSTFKSSMNTRR